MGSTRDRAPDLTRSPTEARLPLPTRPWLQPIVSIATPPPEPVAALMRRLIGVDIEQRPVCHAGRLRIVAVFLPGHLPAPALEIA